MIVDKIGKKILMIMCQALPGKDSPTTGGSLRAQNLGLALSGCGHQVVYGVPARLCNNIPLPSVDFPQISYEINELDKVISKVSPDLILFVNWGLAVEASPCDLPIIIDMILLAGFWLRV
jgi:hypothetical protein